jgi:hypothetical protein
LGLLLFLDGIDKCVLARDEAVRRDLDDVEAVEAAWLPVESVERQLPVEHPMACSEEDAIDR